MLIRKGKDRRRTKPWVAPREGGYIPRYLTPEERAEKEVGPPYDDNYPPPPPPGRGAAAKAWWAMSGARPSDRPDGQAPPRKARRKN
jgi:hypothetical protein